jgi:aspartyl-tRNA(Asn)/glutamyl-tRNA(Gln) amidotransferase subunit B
VETEFETVIGLETHIQLNTKTKLFSGAINSVSDVPNSLTDPTILGLPGSLPVVNKEAIKAAVALGLALKCEIRQVSTFARKHYFYPDLPKGYQISQYDEPICEKGSLEIQINDSFRTIGITRIHIEEDAGKSLHSPVHGVSKIDLNRAGVPLLEVVSEPDIRSPTEAIAYLKSLQQIVTYLGLCDGNMDLGNIRCDANISLRRKGTLKFGIRNEIKNLNSFKFLGQALEYEIARHSSLLRGGQIIVQETRLYDPDKDETRSMRGKENSADYRYFPDPDLPPIVVDKKLIKSIIKNLPLLPKERRDKYQEQLGLSSYDTNLLTADKETADFFDEVLNHKVDPKIACNWIIGELFANLKKNSLTLANSIVSPQNFAYLIKLIESQEISVKIAKGVFEEMFTTGKDPREIVRDKDVKQITDSSALEPIIDKILETNCNQVKQYLEGKASIRGYFVGLVMKATNGKAKPDIVNELLDKAFERAKL